jgi:serine/threonine protein kinase/tetratricopeptide (TPR) repeat protein
MINPADPPTDESARPPEPTRSDPHVAKEVFVAALALPPEQRAAFIEAACRAHPHIRARVEALLAAYDGAAGFLEGGSAGGSLTPAPGESTHRAGGVMLDAAPAPLIGTRVGPYKLLERIGEGGFGAVYMAEQREPVHRKVALKLIKPGMDTRQVIARFEAERQALALMEHPHIARVFDGGVTDAAMGARPYFVMEYVRGDPITSFADAHLLSIRDRLDLFSQVCQAVQHAHTKGIIHRDLKPRNVLVSMVDGKPFAKVIDFGIAKATGSPLTDKTLFTEHRQLIGTPAYMSPEQAEGSPDIDTRTDVYALGVLLYELLTGATPFDAKRLRSAAFAEMQRIIKEEEPPLPSVRLSRSLAMLAATAREREAGALRGGPAAPSPSLSLRPSAASSLPGTIARNRSADPQSLARSVRGDLDWITMKALDKDRARRYETASQLAADVQRHLSGEPVVAAPPSTAYRIRKFVRRHRGPVIAASLVTAALALGVVGTTLGLFHARAAEQRATDEAERASRLANVMQSTLFGLSNAEDLAASRDLLKELIASAASATETLDPARWPNVRLALRLIEGHWRETPPSTEGFSRLLTGLLDSALASNDGREAASRDAALSEHNARGVLLVLTGRLGEAEQVFRAALDSTTLGGDRQARLTRADQLTRWALVAEAAGSGGARARFAEALALRRQELEPQHLDTAESMEDLERAIYPGEMGSIGTRLDLLEKCLAARRAAGVAPESIARVLSRIGEIKAGYTEGQASATQYLRVALENWQRVFSGDHIKVADALIALGRHLTDHGDPHESLRIIRQGLDIVERLEPGPGERMAAALRYLAAAQDRIGQFALAADTAERAIKMCDRLGPRARNGWYYALFQMCDSCRRLAATDQADSAESCYRKLVPLAAMGATWGDEQADRRIRTEFRHFLQWRGRPDEAVHVISNELMYHVHYATGEFGVDRRNEGLPYAQRLTDELEDIGDSLLATGRYAEAEDSFRRCLTRREQIRLVANDGSDGSFLLPLAGGKLGWALMKQGKFPEGELLLLDASESLFHDSLRHGARREAIERLLLLYDAWQAVQPDEGRSAQSAKWRERLATLELASGLGEYLGIENVRTLLIMVSAGDSLSYSEWKRARTFIRLMTGEWTEDPITSGGFRDVIALAIRTVDGEHKSGASGQTVVVSPDKSSADYIVSDTALCALDGRWEDADAALARAVGVLAGDDGSDEALRLLGCQAAVKESLGKSGYAHALYARIKRALESRPAPDPLQMAGAIFDTARTTPSLDGGESESVAAELRRALDLLSPRLPADDPRFARCLLELATAVQVGNALPADQQEQADSLFKEVIGRLEDQRDTRPLILAEALRRYGAWLTERWHAFPPSRAAATLERAAVLYRNAGLTDSPQLADALGNLGGAFGNDGRFKEAAGALCESAELRLALGESGLAETPGHDAGVIPDIVSYADCLAASDDLPNAERFYRAAVSIAERDAAGAYTARDARVRLRRFLLWSGRADEASTILDAEPNWFGTRLPLSDYDENLAERCRYISAHLLKSRQPADADRAVQVIQRGVSILEARVPQAQREAWSKHDFDSLLGDALVVQGKFDEAEPMLLASYEGLRSEPKTPETSDGQDRRREALERIVRMYDAWHLAQPAKGADSAAAEWRARLENPASAPASQP